MYKDPTEFRARFKAYKEGKMPYENGLPKFHDGTSGLSPDEAFVASMGPLLYRELLYQGVENPDSVYNNLITQLGYESNRGRSRVAREQHNYGGVGWNGKRYFSYKNDADFVHDYVKLMNRRYKNAILAKTLSEYAAGIKKLGYFEDTLENYSRNLIGMKSLAKAVAKHKAANPDLYKIDIQRPVSEPIINPVDNTKVVNTIPAEQTHTKWEGALNVSPYLTNKPLLILNPRITVPSVTEPPMLYNSWFENRRSNNIRKMMDNTLSLLFNDEDSDDLLYAKNGKLPKYGDGTRYLWDEDKKEWDRITNNEYARAFADLTITPKGGKLDIRTNPVYHDPRLKNAGYVTKTMLEDEANSKKQKETAIYAPGLELVNPEFDILLSGRQLATNFIKNISRSNPKIELQDAINAQFKNKENSGRVFDEYAKEYFKNKTTFKTPFKVGERSALSTLTVGDVIDFNYGLYGGKNKLLSELTPNLRYSLAKASLLAEERPSMNMIVHMDDSGLLPVNRYGFVPKDATNSKSVWNSSLQGEPEIWWNRGSAYYSPYGYPTIQNIPRTIVADLLKLSDAGINLTGHEVMHGPGVVPFESVEYGLQPNEFGWFDTIKFKGYKDGKSPIHIKSANRGKLTRLKARTGKSESELYNDGNPAHKKMVVFARNARKWKH